MRTVSKTALVLVSTVALLIAGCSNGDNVTKEVSTPVTQPTVSADPGNYDDDETQAKDTEVCVDLQEQAININQQMKDRQDGTTNLEEFRDHLESFLNSDSTLLTQASESASDLLIPQDTEDFLLTVKFLEGYISNGGELSGQTVVITDDNTPALDTLGQLEPVEAFQLQVAATESIEEEDLAHADDEEYEHRIFGACYTLGVDVAPNAYNLHFTQETKV